MSRPSQESSTSLSAPHYETYSEADFDGYHAAPLLLSGGEADVTLVARQDAIADAFERAVHGELADVAKEGVRAFVATSIRERMHQREALNSASYSHRLFPAPYTDMITDMTALEVDDVCETVKLGLGTPCQNELARRALGMSSVEIANLTVIGDFRRDLEAPMWEDVSELVGKDATPQPDQMYRLKLLGFDRPDIMRQRHIGAMRVEMKRRIGSIGDDTMVKARTTAIINTSPSSGFDQSLIERFKQVGGKPELISELPEFKRAMAWLISSELSYGIVLSRNETVYAENEGIRRALSQSRLFVRPNPRETIRTSSTSGTIEAIRELAELDRASWGL